ncbi:MAG: TolC family protein [Planctomycetaceae bacterium]|nr:TolC family protein [Planctomycetaceae bacterium]
MDLAEAQQQTEESHPLLQAAAKRKEAAQRALELERTKRWQDWDLDLLGGRSADAEFILEAGVRIPFPLRDRNQAGIRSAEIRAAQADLQFDAARNELLPRVGEAYDAFMAARDRVAIFRSTILPQATKALEQTREGYRVGKFEYLDLLDAQRTLAEAKVGYTAAVAELNESAATIEELSGMRFTTEPKED